MLRPTSDKLKYFSGLAKSMVFVIIGRVIAGVGGAGCQTLVSLIIFGTDSFEDIYYYGIS
jgi:hypothetical protein